MKSTVKEFDGYCPTCGQCWQGHADRLWMSVLWLYSFSFFVFGSIFGYYILPYLVKII